MAYTVMTYMVMAYRVLALYGYGLYSSGLHSYGLYGYGLYVTQQRKQHEERELHRVGAYARVGLAEFATLDRLNDHVAYLPYPIPCCLSAVPHSIRRTIPHMPCVAA